MTEIDEKTFLAEQKLAQREPPTKLKPIRARRLKQVMLVHRITPATKMVAVVSKRFASDVDYVCRFFDTQDDAEAYAATLDDPAALFTVKAAPSPNPTPQIGG